MTNGLEGKPRNNAHFFGLLISEWHVQVNYSPPGKHQDA